MGRTLTKNDNITLQLITLAVPLILGNILQQFYNTFDAFVLQHYAGNLEFSAIGVAGSIMNLFLFAITGMCNGMLVLFSQYHGANDMESYRKEHATAFFVGMCAALVACVGGILLLPTLLRIMRTPEVLIPYARTYLTVIFLALPFSFLYNLYGNILRSLGKTFLATMALFSAVVINLVLDIILVKYLNFGILGAAIATAVSQMLAAGVCILALFLGHKEIWFHREHIRLEGTFIRKTIYFGAVTALQQCSIYLGKLLVQGTVNNQGIDMIAAYTATTRIEAFANSFGDSGSTATAIVVAHNYGAKDRDKVKKTFFHSWRLLFVFGLIISAIMYATIPFTVRLLLGNSSAAAYQNAMGYLKWISVFYVFCFTGNTLAGFYHGVGKVNLPFIGSATHLSMRAILSILFIAAYQLPAVAFATGFGWIYVNLFWLILLGRYMKKELPQLQ